MESTERRSTTELPVPTDIRQCWDTIKPGIVDILDNNPYLTYIPEDVYSECVNGRAFLYTSSVGFLVLPRAIEEVPRRLSSCKHVLAELDALRQIQRRVGSPPALAERTPRLC